MIGADPIGGQQRSRLSHFRLYAAFHVAVHNVCSIRVLDKCGFRRDRVQEADAPASDDGIEEFIFVRNAVGLRSTTHG